VETRRANDNYGSVLEAHPGKSRGRPTTNCGLSAHRTNGLPSQRSPGTPVPERRQPTTGPGHNGLQDAVSCPYNRRRPHGALSHKPPIARLHELNNLLGSYT